MWVSHITCLNLAFFYSQVPEVEGEEDEEGGDGEDLDDIGEMEEDEGEGEEGEGEEEEGEGEEEEEEGGEEEDEEGVQVKVRLLEIWHCLAGSDIWRESILARIARNISVYDAKLYGGNLGFLQNSTGRIRIDSCTWSWISDTALICENQA